MINSLKSYFWSQKAFFYADRVPRQVNEVGDPPAKQAERYYSFSSSIKVFG